MTLAKTLREVYGSGEGLMNRSGPGGSQVA